MRISSLAALCLLSSRCAAGATSFGPWRAGAATIEKAAPITNPNKKAAADGTTFDDVKKSKLSGEQLTNSPTSQREAPLLADIELLSGILSELVNREDPRVHDLYENFRTLGLERAANPFDDDKSTAALNKMIKAAASLSAEEAVGVLRCFSVMLNLVNSAEVQHRRRLVRSFVVNDTAGKGSALPPTPDSMRGTIDLLLRSNEATPAQIMKQLCTQKVEIVLTAHPTQVQRKSLLRKYRIIGETLGALEEATNPYDKFNAKLTLQRTVSSIWGADEIRRNKPTPQQEAAGGSAVIESVLWEAVPAYLRALSMQCEEQLGMPLPIDAVPIKFSSWIGGDRDGNPNVTPMCTREVVLQQRLRASRLLIKDLYDLISELAISCRFSPEMETLSRSIPDSSPHKLEKYRRVLDHLLQRMIKTSRLIEGELASITLPENIPGGISLLGERASAVNSDEIRPVYEESELLVPLKIMYDSLVQTGFDVVANGALADIIRRVTCFGLSLLPLDIREESTKHTEALDAVTRYLGLGSYREWDEQARLSFLTSELSSKRPLISDRELNGDTFPPDVAKTLQTFATAASLRPSALGAYVISQAQTASDVLAVMLLQKQFGMTQKNGSMMRVVPLFETLDDLVNAPSVMTTLFSIPVYVGAIKGKQEVMVGYSDSAKDAGRLAACWAQFISQEKMAKVASDFGVELTFFHGKGGTVGRGGNPSVYRAIMSHPPNTINGRFRVTEQGEMITQNFGTTFVAQRSLDIYTAAVCRESFLEHIEPKASWRSLMEKISAISCADYRQLVREEPRFVPYFRQATPELELGVLNIGSRPSKRNPKGGVESLRAIPWTFAWAQTRSHLSAWLGVGAGLTTNVPEELATLQEMYEDWPWFSETVDLIAMIVSKTDFSIGKNYDDQLVDKSGDLMKMGEEMRQKLVQTRQSILDVTKSTDVAGNHIALQRASSMIRHPYIDPVNVMQAELLKRYRALDNNNGGSLSQQDKELKQHLHDALVLSINAIAQGMKNSG